MKSENVKEESESVAKENQRNGSEKRREKKISAYLAIMARIMAWHQRKSAMAQRYCCGARINACAAIAIARAHAAKAASRSGENDNISEMVMK